MQQPVHIGNQPTLPWLRVDKHGHGAGRWLLPVVAMKRFYLTMLWLLRQSNSDARASLDSDCAMRFQEIEGGLPPDTSYWVYNPTVVRTDGGNYHGLARVSLSLGDGGGCNAAEASRSGTSAEDVVAAADAVLYCRKWYSGGHRDLVIQWWAPADDICDARVAKILGEGEDPRLYRAAAGAAHPFYLTVQRWELLAFDDDFGAFEVTRAIYQAPVTARGGPANGELFDTRLVMEDRRTCGDYAAHDCPFELGKDYKAYWLWPRLLWACGGSPAGAGRLGWMFWASTWNATSHLDWRFPFCSQTPVAPSSRPLVTWQRQLGSRVVGVILYSSMALNVDLRSPSCTLRPRARMMRTKTQAPLSALSSRLLMVVFVGFLLRLRAADAAASTPRPSGP